MLTTFWSSVEEELARNWVAKVLTPAFAFWVGGLGLVWWNMNSDYVSAEGWSPALVASADQLGRLPVLVQGALVVSALVLIAASGVIAERLTFPVLQLLEGYWTWPSPLHRFMVGRRRRRYRRVRDRAQTLQLRQRRGSLTVAEYQELLRLRSNPDGQPERLAVLEHGAGGRQLTPLETTRLGRDLQWLQTTPDRDDLGMPTRLGDILRAAERRPASSYGLDAVVCWTALSLLLPREPRVALTQARSALDGAVRGWLWGALFLVWSPFSWWAVLVGVGVPLVSYRFGVLPRGIEFGELIVTFYDLYRMKLYVAMHFPVPQSIKEERYTAGPRVTKALSGTLDEQGLRYLFDPPSATIRSKPAKRRAGG